MNALIEQPDPVTSVDWVRRANSLQAPWGMFVDGEQLPARNGSVSAVRSPRDGATLVELAWADEEDVDVAVAAARRAFDDGPWPRLPPRERGEILQRFAALVEQHRDEIALLVSLEMGKPISHAWRIELRALIRCLRFYGELADKGSTAVGRHFLRYAADSNLKRVFLELGGKSPNIILPDAPDLDAAADTAAWAIFFNSGEMCTAGSRVVVHEDVADRVVQRIVETAATWFPADPLLATTKMGPLSTGGAWTGSRPSCGPARRRARSCATAAARCWPIAAGPTWSRPW